MTARNEHRALKRAGLVHITGWIREQDLPEWQRIETDAHSVIAEATGSPKPRGRPKKPVDKQT
jgi:hypothetical protein